MTLRCVSIGVLIRHWLTPKAMRVHNGQLSGMTFARTHMQDGKLVETNEQLELNADMVLKAVGQLIDSDPISLLRLKQGRIEVDGQGRTGVPKLWAGGDCRFGGRDLTVQAVEDGKQAAISIDQQFRGAA